MRYVRQEFPPAVMDGQPPTGVGCASCGTDDSGDMRRRTKKAQPIPSRRRARVESDDGYLPNHRTSAPTKEKMGVRKKSTTPSRSGGLESEHIESPRVVLCGSWSPPRGAAAPIRFMHPLGSRRPGRPAGRSAAHAGAATGASIWPAPTVGAVHGVPEPQAAGPLAPPGWP